MRTCAIRGAELPASLRHGAKYCPHGQCKTQAYRSRKREAQKQEAGNAPTLVPTPLAPKPSPSAPTAPISPLRFSHSLTCTCGQQLDIQILISHAQAAQPSASAPPPMVTVDQVNSPRARMALDAAQPMEEFDPEREWPLSGSSSAAEQMVLALEPGVVVPKEPYRQLLLPLETAHIAANEGATVLPEAPLPLSEVKSQTPEAPQESLSDSTVQAPLPSERIATEPQNVPRFESLGPPSQSESPSPPRQPAPPALPAEDSVRREFWLLAKERPEQAMRAFYRLLDEGHIRNELSLIERAYCGLALVHALRGDGPRAAERLSDARAIAIIRRGNTTEVEALAHELDRLLSAK